MAKVIDVYVYRLVPDPASTTPASSPVFMRVDSVTRRGIPVDGRVLADAVNVQFAQLQAPGTPVYSHLTWNEGDAAGSNLQEAYFIDSLATLIGKINA